MAKGASKEVGFRKIDLDKIDRPGGRIRLDMDEDEISELAESIKAQGLLSPIEVVARDDRYEVVFGDRRYLACKKLGLKKMECRVVERSDKEIKIVRAVENVQRANLSPLEEGAAYLDMKEEAGMSYGEISRAVGIGPGAVKRRIMVVRMPESLQKAVHFRKISLGVAEELFACPDGAHRDYLLELAIEHGVTVMVVRGWVNDFKKSLGEQGAVVGRGGGERNPMEPTVVYRPCDICTGPVDLSKVREIRVCPGCGDLIMKALREGGGVDET